MYSEQCTVKGGRCPHPIYNSAVSGRFKCRAPVWIAAALRESGEGAALNEALLNKIAAQKERLQPLSTGKKGTVSNRSLYGILISTQRCDAGIAEENEKG